jgi:hypothetical protein
MTDQYSEDKILQALLSKSLGEEVPDICRRLGITEATLKDWKKKYQTTDIREIRRINSLKRQTYYGAAAGKSNILGSGERYPHCRKCGGPLVPTDEKFPDTPILFSLTEEWTQVLVVSAISILFAVPRGISTIPVPHVLPQRNLKY